MKKTHDLYELLVFCVDYDPDFETLRDACGILNEYITSGRYPGDLPFDDFDENQAEEAIDSANKIKNFVLNQVDLTQEKKR